MLFLSKKIRVTCSALGNFMSLLNGKEKPDCFADSGEYLLSGSSGYQYGTLSKHFATCKRHTFRNLDNLSENN